MTLPVRVVGGLRPRIPAFRWAAKAVHRAISGSEWLSRVYLFVVSTLCRSVANPYLAERVENLVARAGVEWPAMDFAPRSVTLGHATSVQLVPHLGEFCQSALFRRWLSYETEVFRWLEREASDRYDSVVEIGANVGVYTVFLDALIKARPAGRLKSVVCFEPALVPFARLLENLKANRAAHVLPFRAAVADASGFRSFYEPKHHLTNGSLLEHFAGHFTDTVERSVVATHHPADLSLFFEPERKILLKIDVEGYEAQLIAAFGDLIERHRPDIIIEVLDSAPSLLNTLDCLRGYECFLIEPDALRQELVLRADGQHRDWLLRWPDSPGAGAGSRVPGNEATRAAAFRPR
jgi:FkbM family methyltransferase